MNLLEDATASSPPDHQACAKYADLLFKMLPKGSGDKAGLQPDDLARARKAVIHGFTDPETE